MSETITVLVSLLLLLLVALSIRIYGAHTKKRVGHISKIKSQVRAKMSTGTIDWTVANSII